MKLIWEWIKNNPNRTMFLVPILLVAGISISHVVSWYDIANPISWAIYLSIAIEIGAMSALVAATNKIKGGVWFMFSLVTFIQMIGNIFFSYKEIDANGELFKSWMELTNPVWEALGSDKHKEDEVTPQVETKIVEVIKEVPVEKIVEKIVEVPVDREVIVEKIVEVPVQVKQEDEDIKKYWEEVAEDLYDQELTEITTTTTTEGKKVLSYTKPD